MEVGGKAIVKFIVKLAKDLSHGLWAVSGVPSGHLRWSRKEREGLGLSLETSFLCALFEIS